MNLDNKTLAELNKLLKASKTASDRNRIRATIRKKETSQRKIVKLKVITLAIGKGLAFKLFDK